EGRHEGRDDGDDEEESSEDEEDDEMDVPSAKETEPFETDESAATPPPYPSYRTTARISIPAPVPMPAWTDSELPFASRREDKPEVTLPPRKRLDIAFGPREIMRNPEREVGYGITDSWDEIVET
nr:hypothetical protein [Tanacetum cinerariifolium]